MQKLLYIFIFCLQLNVVYANIDSIVVYSDYYAHNYRVYKKRFGRTGCWAPPKIYEAKEYDKGYYTRKSRVSNDDCTAINNILTDPAFLNSPSDSSQYTSQPIGEIVIKMFKKGEEISFFCSFKVSVPNIFLTKSVFRMKKGPVLIESGVYSYIPPKELFLIIEKYVAPPVSRKYYKVLKKQSWWVK